MKWATLTLTIILFLALLVFGQPRAEGLHLDFGLGYHNPKFDSFKQKDGTDISNLIGEVELSYELKSGTSIFIRHNSSMQQDDTGLNLIGIKARIF